VRVELRASVPDPAINRQLAVAGAGVVLLAQSIARPDVEQGRLVRLLPDWEPDPVELHALYSSRLNSSPKVRAFLEFLRERLLDVTTIASKTETANRPSETISPVGATACPR
jgi:DNA-binding transcriptional LysR family regulator